MRTLYRISHKDHSPQDPGGAMRRPGRWHAQGSPVLYTAESLALAVLELRVNEISFARIRRDYHFSVVDASGLRPQTVPESFFEEGWRDAVGASRTDGARWLRESASGVLKVRSSVLPEEWNCVLNTEHPDFSKVRFSAPRPIPLDERLQTPAEGG
jgi:RES domain-containing protein